MAKLDEDFAFLVLEVVAEIPRGRVATYGQVADLIGYPRNARLVGKVLSRAEYYGRYPCQRVVNSQGACAPSWPAQRELLLEEGITFKENGRVDLKRWQWDGEL